MTRRLELATYLALTMCALAFLAGHRWIIAGVLAFMAVR